MLLGTDVFNVKGLVLVVVLVKLAVFASAASAIPDEGSKRVIHHSAWGVASNWRAFDFKIAMKVAYETYRP